MSEDAQAEPGAPILRLWAEHVVLGSGDALRVVPAAVEIADLELSHPPTAHQDLRGDATAALGKDAELDVEPTGHPHHRVASIDGLKGVKLLVARSEINTLISDGCIRASVQLLLCSVC